MQLLFVWIEDFYSIKNQNFNFGFEYYCSYNKVDNSITFDKQKYIVPDYFFGENILNASAIVGENGAGKTTLINYIYGFLGNFYSKGVFLIKTENNEYILYHHKDFEGLKITNEEKIDVKIKKSTYDNITTAFDDGKLEVVYFSNAFSIKKFWKTRASVVDLSTTTLIEEKKSVDIYKISELRKQVDFIENKPSDFKISFESRLKSIDVYFDNIDIVFIVKAASKLNLYNNFLKYIESEEAKPGWRKLSNPCLIPYLLAVSLVPTILELKHNQKTDVDYLRLLEVSPLILNDTPDLDYLRAVLDFLRVINRDISNSDGDVREKLDGIYNLLLFVIRDIRTSPKDYQLYIKKNLDYVSIDIIDFHFEIASNRFNSFEEKLAKIKLTNKIINFNWSLSSGENAYLTLYSRLFEYARLKNLDKDSTGLKKLNYVWLILDEVELYMHPQWQKEFVKRITEFISFAFTKAKVQIFLTSHSPLVIGDFPKNNIAFIQRKSGFTEVSKIEHEETFGSNIFNLFTDSFFIQDGLTGDFASEKIDKVLHLTSTEESIQENYEFINAITKFIGEPILKDHIEKRLEYFSLDEEKLTAEYNKIGKLLKKAGKKKL